MAKLLLATTNRGKIREYRSLLKDLVLELVTPDELSIKIEVREDFPSYEENARMKANAYASVSHLPTLADDSGLEVDALGGEPGILSARAADSDEARIKYLLSRLKGVPREKRTAHFKCVIALAELTGKTELSYGECAGLIALEPRGENGFGYDPVFFLPELGKTMAELPLGIKNQISHRSKAARAAFPVLQKIARK